MAKYSEKEKDNYLKEYKESKLSLSKFAKEKGLSQATLKYWVQKANDLSFGEVEMESQEQKPQTFETKSSNNFRKPITFSTEDIKIELKEGFNKELLRRIVEVLIYAN